MSRQFDEPPPESRSNSVSLLAGRDPEIEMKGGLFAVVRSLLRVLESGHFSKSLLDLVIDKCSAMQNLREAIAGYR